MNQKKVNIYFEPVNTLQWNIFEKINHIGHIEPFYAVQSMWKGDLVILHVGTQDMRYESGIYAYGTIVRAPYPMEPGRPEPEGRLYTDVRIDYMQWNRPIVKTQEAKLFISTFRKVHMLNPQNYDLIRKIVFKDANMETTADISFIEETKKQTKPTVINAPGKVEQPEKVSVSIGEKLVHKAYGKGVVYAIDNNHVKVKFDQVGEKTFPYPDSFTNGFLKKL